MSVHLMPELGKLKRLNLSVGACAEEAIAKAVTALSTPATRRWPTNSSPRTPRSTGPKSWSRRSA